MNLQLMPPRCTISWLASPRFASAKLLVVPHQSVVHRRRNNSIMSANPGEPRITGQSALSSAEAKWVELKKIEYIDETGCERTWEVASRKTRGSAGVDAVGIGNIILHPSRPPSTMLVLQYRPPVDATTVEWPAGLIDVDESAEEAAMRELREETGYRGRVLSVSPAIASDPGMTTANMQLVMVEVSLEEGEEEPEQHLDDGEHIKRIVVPLDQLYERLMDYSMDYSKQKGMMVAAKLFHWAAGMHFAKNMLPNYNERKPEDSQPSE